jgi:HSP20 family protein
MVDKKISDEFAQGKERLGEIGRRLGEAFGKTNTDSAGGGFFAGMGNLVEQLGKLVEQAEQSGGVTNKSGEFKFGSGSDSKTKGVYGFSIKSGLGDKGGVKVEPFGNIRKDDDGKLVAVHEIREPMVDLFDEPGRLLIVAEVPGVDEANLKLELQDDILLIATVKGEPNYRKELLLPESFAQKDLSFQCRNGVLEIVLKKEKAKKARS